MLATTRCLTRAETDRELKQRSRFTLRIQREEPASVICNCFGIFNLAALHWAFKTGHAAFHETTLRCCEDDWHQFALVSGAVRYFCHSILQVVGSVFSLFSLTLMIKLRQ
jgi:hypothetical protein